MNNILKQAKELEEEIDFSFTKDVLILQKQNNVKKEATKLLKIAREGCGKKFEPIYIFGNKVC